MHLQFENGEKDVEGLANALKKNSLENLTLVATTGFGYAEMAQNLYETSIGR